MQTHPVDVSEIVGQNIRARRLQLGMSQDQLADAVGTYKSHISAIENGVKTITLPTLVQWAKALRTSAANLLRERRKRA